MTILFVDEQLSPISSTTAAEPPHVGEQVQWNQAAYLVLAVRRYYAGAHEPLYDARVVVQPIED